MVAQDTLLFTSILLLIVVNMSFRIQDDNLKKIAVQHSGFPLNLPNLGRFSFVHFANVTLLFFGYYVIIIDILERWGDEPIGVKAVILILIFVLILVLLPFFEQRSYDNLFKKGGLPFSYQIHSACVIFGVLLLLLITASVSFVWGSLLAVIVYMVLFLTVVFVGTGLFLRELKLEYKPDSVQSEAETPRSWKTLLVWISSAWR